MGETGRVYAVSGDMVTIERELSGACFGCTRRECPVNHRFITLENQSAQVPLPGQLVEAAVPLKTLLVQALAAGLPPVLGFIAGFLVTGFIFPHSGEPARAAAGVFCLFAAALILYRVRRRFPPKPCPGTFRVRD
jgi:sigma-E factor negative regulatory protein RseC